MDMTHGFRRIVVIENDEASGVTDDELREAALEKGLVGEGDIVVFPGDESYNNLADLPSINGVKVVGDMKSEDFGLETEELTNIEIEQLFKQVFKE